MRGINYMAALGTIFLFISVYSFKAAFYKKTFKEEMKEAKYVPTRNYGKPFLLFFSVICFILGLLLILRSLKII